MIRAGEAMPTNRAMPKWKPAPEDLVRLFYEEVARTVPEASVRKMFGYPAAFTGGNMFASLFEDSFVVRLDDSSRETLAKKPGARVFEPMPGRPMREYMVLPDSVLASSRSLRSWLLKAHAYASSLSPKRSPVAATTGRAKSSHSPPKHRDQR
jgi:TfoX/Sxy family transcriptional regulator of competence genes